MCYGNTYRYMRLCKISRQHKLDNIKKSSQGSDRPSMGLVQIHAGLGNTAVLFIAALGIWALGLRVMSRPLDSTWYGAAMIGEVLILVQGAIGGLLYLQGLDVALTRPFMHILYGVVAIVCLPAAQSYFGNLEDENTKTLAMAATCAFLWGILLRASYVVDHAGPAF